MRTGRVADVGWLLAVAVLCVLALSAAGVRAEVPDAAPPAGSVQNMMMHGMQAMATTVRERLALMRAAAPQLLQFPALFADRLTAGGQVPGWRVALTFGLVFCGGLAAEGLFRRTLRRARSLAEAGPTDTAKRRWTQVGMHLLISALAIGVFSLGCSLAYFASEKLPPAAQAVLFVLFGAVLIVRVVAAVGAALFSPDRPAARPLPLTDNDARYLYSRLVLFTLVATIGGTGSQLATALAADEGMTLLLVAITLTLTFLALILLVWHDREQLRRIVPAPAQAAGGDAGEAAASVQRLIADLLPAVVITLLVLVWAFALYTRLTTGQSALWPVMATLILIIVLPTIELLSRVGIEHLVGARPPEAAGHAADAAGDATGDAAADAAARQRLDYARVIMRNVRIVLFVGGALIFADIWNISIKENIGAGMGERVAESAFTIAITVILASAAWGLVKATIRHNAPDETFDVTKLDEMQGAHAVASRMKTVTVLFGRFVLATLAVIVILIILSALGVNIGPLLAGAGVVGLAIGFGAQTLVRDIITGVFFLLEDAFRVGEYVDVGIARGTVESISVRSMRLRHHLGQIHTVPFGVIKNLTNFSRDWAIMKLDLRLPFDTDLEKVRKLVKRVGQEMMADVTLRDAFLQPLKSQGATRMDDDAFIVRVKFMAKPGEQFVLRREVFRRIQDAFRQNGIRFAPRRVIVDHAGDSSAATVRDAEAAAAAAVAAGGPGREAGKAAADDRR